MSGGTIPPGMTPSSLSDRDRLLLIVRAFVACEEVPTEKGVGRQFKVETGRGPAKVDLLWVLKKEGW